MFKKFPKPKVIWIDDWQAVSIDDEVDKIDPKWTMLFYAKDKVEILG